MILSAESITVTLEGLKVLENITFEIEGPGLMAVMGPNGAGKTTLLRVIAGLIRPDKGRVIINGTNVTGSPEKAGRFISLVPQRPPRGRFAPITPWSLVCTSLTLREYRWPRTHRKCPKDVVEKALRMAGVPRGHWHSRLATLSGGLLMRSYIARSFAINKEMVLMDEPLAPIDPAGRMSLAETIVRLSRKSLVILSLHDPVPFMQHLKAILLLDRRLIAYGPPDEVLRPEVLRKVYGASALQLGTHVHIVDYHWGGEQ